MRNDRRSQTGIGAGRSTLWFSPAHRRTVFVPVLVILALAGPPLAAQTYEPVYIIFNYHLDPLGPNPQAAQNAYPNHRDAVQWATGLSLSAGVKISAGSTGPYAEACVINGHEADFQTFMPGGHNALGTHLHAHRKLPGFVDYQWEDVGAGDRPPSIAAEVFADQIGYVNQIYVNLGFAATDNAFFHGTHVQSQGWMDQLYLGGGIAPFTYPNTFVVQGAARGLYHPYRGGGTGGEDLGGPYVRIPLASGIAGQDSLHGPEGFVYGTLPYLKKDFLLEYLEWRFAQSHGLLDRVWTYGWGSHPYQTTSTYVGTDGVPVRQTITSLVAWLNGRFVEQTSAEGNTIARHANYIEVRDRFLLWEQQHPGESSIDGDPIAGPNHALPATADMLATSYYEAEIAAAPAVEIHRFIDRNDGTARFVAWTDAPLQTIDLSAQIAGLVVVTDHTGVVSFSDSSAVAVARDPLVVTAARPGDFDGDSRVDEGDLGTFIAVLVGLDSDPVHVALADMNGDGTADGNDVQPFVGAIMGG